MRRGLTLIEIIFVIVIIGILSAVLAPSFNRPTLDQAANQIVSHIRYTQHLAMVENKFDPSDEFWYRSRWQIDFRDSAVDDVYYTIYQDLNRNGDASTVVSKNEIAKNPLNSKQLLTGLSTNTVNTADMILSDKYGINGIEFNSTTCSSSNSQRISFDYLGRPLFGNPKSLRASYNNNANYSKAGIRLVQKRCTITLIGSDGNKTIAIEPETGYTHIIL